MAAVDFFLKLDGIDGESVDDKHKGEIEITSWSWGVNQTSHAGGGGGGAGKSVPLDFTFGHRIDKASPKLMLACATGQHIKQATLTCRKAGGQQQEYIKILQGQESVKDGLDNAAKQFQKLLPGYSIQ